MHGERDQKTRRYDLFMRLSASQQQNRNETQWKHFFLNLNKNETHQKT